MLPRRRRSRDAHGSGEDRLRLERYDGELGRRTAQEGADEEQLLEIGLQQTVTCPAPRRREARLDLEMSAAPRRKGAGRCEAAAGDEERARVTRLDCGDDETASDCMQRLEPRELAADLLERPQAVAQPCGVLVPARVGELTDAAPEPRQRERRPLELVGEQRPGGKLRPAARADRTL